MDPAWVGALAALAVAAFTIGAWAARWAWRLLIGTHDFLVEWPKVLAAIADLRHQVADIKAETRPNGGHSLRDVVHRTARDVADIKDEQARLRAQIELRHPPPTGKEGP